MGARDKMLKAEDRKTASTPVVHQTLDSGLPKQEPQQTKREESIPQQDSNPANIIQKTYTELDDSVPTTIRKVARPDKDINLYQDGPYTTTYGIYNEELDDWLRNFSRKNSRRKGAKINQASLIEACMDVIMYDIGLQPTGWKHVNEIRDFIRSKLK